MENIEIKQLENSEIELSGEIPAADFSAKRAGAVNRLNQATSLDGFRQGHAPEAVLIARLGEERVLLEMAELALAEAYPKIIAEKSLDVIGRPEITITKLAKDNPLGFKIKTAVHPQFNLPNYQELAREINRQPAEPVVITDQELDEALEQIRQSRANPETKTVPELNDDFAQSLGNFPTLVSLREKIKENMTLEREHKNRDKRRLEIMDRLIEKSEITLPAVLIAGELERMLAEMKQDIERLGLKFEDYLTHLKKTEPELREAWRPEAVKRVKTGLILEQIAKAEKLSPEAEAVAAEVKHLQSHYQEAAPERVQAYVLSVLTNEKVWQFLEEQK